MHMNNSGINRDMNLVFVGDHLGEVVKFIKMFHYFIKIRIPREIFAEDKPLFCLSGTFIL